MKSLYESILSSTNTGKTALIRAWLDKNDIKNYTINDKGEIDVDGSVVLTNNNFGEFPKYIQFNIVKRNFYCSYNKLTSLKGAPKKVGGDFECSFNNLTTLEGAPIEVGGRFDCSFNKIISLEGAPNIVDGYFNCTNNKLTSLKGAPKKVGGNFYCQDNATKFTEVDVMNVCKVKKGIIIK